MAGLQRLGITDAPSNISSRRDFLIQARQLGVAAATLGVLGCDQIDQEEENRERKVEEEKREAEFKKMEREYLNGLKQHYNDGGKLVLRSDSNNIFLNNALSNNPDHNGMIYGHFHQEKIGPIVMDSTQDYYSIAKYQREAFQKGSSRELEQVNIDGEEVFLHNSTIYYPFGISKYNDRADEIIEGYTELERHFNEGGNLRYKNKLLNNKNSVIILVGDLPILFSKENLRFGGSRVSLQDGEAFFHRYHTHTKNLEPLGKFDSKVLPNHGFGLDLIDLEKSK